MLDYDREARSYDASRGGTERAEAAAEAYAELLTPAVPGPLLDLACGTGLVTAALGRRTGRTVFGTDLSAGMLTLAAPRLPGRTLRADAARLPFADGGLAGVTAIWLLHLLPAEVGAAVIAEVARVLAPGGVFATTVDKNGRPQAHEAARAGPAPDAEGRILILATASGLVLSGAATFVGHGQGRRGGPEPVYRVCACVRQRRTGGPRTGDR